MKDRRKTPRIKFAKKPVITVRCILKRFFLIKKEIIGTLCDFSEVGASLLVQQNYTKYISRANLGQRVHLVSENSSISFQLDKFGQIVRITESENRVSIAVLFTDRSASSQ